VTAGARLDRPIEVLKFGGSSVADTARLQRVGA
jgi:aspartokinase